MDAYVVPEDPNYCRSVKGTRNSVEYDEKDR